MYTSEIITAIITLSATLLGASFGRSLQEHTKIIEKISQWVDETLYICQMYYQINHGVMQISNEEKNAAFMKRLTLGIAPIGIINSQVIGDDNLVAAAEAFKSSVLSYESSFFNDDPPNVNAPIMKDLLAEVENQGAHLYAVLTHQTIRNPIVRLLFGLKQRPNFGKNLTHMAG